MTDHDSGDDQALPMFRDIGPRLVWGGFVHNEGDEDWPGNRL